MEAYIDDTAKRVFVLTDDVGMAYALGRHFKEDHPDLAIWGIYCRPASAEIAWRGLYRRERITGVGSLGQAIRRSPSCTHSCPRHPGAEG